MGPLVLCASRQPPTPAADPTYSSVPACGVERQPEALTQLFIQPLLLKPAQPCVVAQAARSTARSHGGSKYGAPGPHGCGVPTRFTQPPGALGEALSLFASFSYVMRAAHCATSSSSSTTTTIGCGWLSRRCLTPPCCEKA